METTFVSAILMSFIFCGSLLYCHLLRKRRLYHSTFKTFQVSLFFYLAHCLLSSAYYCQYGYEGTAPRAVWVAARLGEVVATCCFLGLLLALSNGYTIVSASLTICGFGVLLTFTGFFSLLMLSCIIWEENIFDPAAVLYSYQSPPGYLLTGIYLPAWLYFIANCICTGYRYKRKRSFYLALGLFYSAWLLALPLLVFSGNSLLPDWVRMKTVRMSEQAVWLSSYIYLLLIFTPAQSNKHFPFHLRATKVDLEEPRHDNNYLQPADSPAEGDQDQGTPPYVDIFTVT